jgi:hypothetical protein
MKTDHFQNTRSGKTYDNGQCPKQSHLSRTLFVITDVPHKDECAIQTKLGFTLITLHLIPLQGNSGFDTLKNTKTI